MENHVPRQVAKSPQKIHAEKRWAAAALWPRFSYGENMGKDTMWGPKKR
jgi:hypothetical protein